MSEDEILKFTFEGLCSDDAETTLAYMVGLVDSANHKIAEPETALRQLYCMDELEGQEAILTPLDLLRAQRLFLLKGYFPQTPVMKTRAWSPVSALLEHGFEPVALARYFSGANAVATGIWSPMTTSDSKSIEYSSTDEDLFWAIMGEVTKRAKIRKQHVSVVATPGWAYDSAIGSLRDWSEADIQKADRVLWKRTPDG